MEGKKKNQDLRFQTPDCVKEQSIINEFFFSKSNIVMRSRMAFCQSDGETEALMVTPSALVTVKTGCDDAELIVNLLSQKD